MPRLIALAIAIGGAALAAIFFGTKVVDKPTPLPVTTAQPAQPAAPRFLIFGDSMTHPDPDSGPNQVDVTGRERGGPGTALAVLLHEMGGQVRIDAKIGRSAMSFFNREDYGPLLAADMAFLRSGRPSVAVIFLGTNDMESAGSKARGALVRLRDALASTGSHVVLIGPPSFADSRATDRATAFINAVRPEFANFVDARLDSADCVVSGRARDGVHFTGEGGRRVGGRLLPKVLAAAGFAS